MNRSESFREYFRRARYDRQASIELLRTARGARRFFGSIVLVFALLALWQAGSQLFHGAGWLSRSVFIDVVGLITNLLVYDKLGERIIALEVLAESLGPSQEQAQAAGAPDGAEDPDAR